MRSNIEEEQKFEITKSIKLSDIEETLIRFGLKKDQLQKQKDIYWDDEDCKITNLKRGLRTRYLSGKLHSIEFKSLFVNSDGNRVIEEIKILDDDNSIDIEILNFILVKRLGFIEINVNQDDIFEEIFSKYNLKPQMILDKTRTIYKDSNNNIEVSIDLINGLSPYIELEFVGKNREFYEYIINSLIKKFGNKLKPVKEGYLDLIAKQNDKILSRQEYADLFIKDYSWNVLPSERQLVDQLFANCK